MVKRAQLALVEQQAENHLVPRMLSEKEKQLLAALTPFDEESRWFIERWRKGHYADLLFTELLLMETKEGMEISRALGMLADELRAVGEHDADGFFERWVQASLG